MNVHMIVLDLREGFRASRRWFLIAAALPVVFGLFFVLTTQARGLDLEPNLGNQLANLLAGMAWYLPGTSTPFQIPASWLVTLLILAYLVLWYPYRDLMGFGQKVLVAGGSRWAWWTSKCVWVVASVFAFWIIIFDATAALTLVFGSSLSLEVSPQIALLLNWYQTVGYSRHQFVLFLLGVPVAMSALCLLQLFLSLVIGPWLSFLVTFCIFFLSAFYYQNQLLLGNYLMTMRSTALVQEGAPPMEGMLVSLVIAIFSIVIGGVCFAHMDILEKER